MQEFIQYFEANIENEKKAKLLIDNLKERMTETVNVEEQIIALQNWMDYVRGWFMYCVAYKFCRNYESIMKGKFQQELIHGTFYEKSMKLLEDAMCEFVYEDAEIV